MTAGLPGTGIGGLFYLLSALVMPFHQAYLALRGRPHSGSWGSILAQMAIAGGILAGMWVAGWLLGLLLAPAVPVATGAGAPAAPNVLRTGMFVIALATLAAVLLAVEVLRLVIAVRERRAAALLDESGPPVPDQPPLRQRRRFRRRVALMLAFGLSYGSPLAGQYDGVIASRLVRAESAYAAGDAARAEAEYNAVLSAEPGNSRATYRLAELQQRRDPEAALALYRRYVALEPRDPWGYVAVAATLSRLGRHAPALKWYDAAGRLAPDERDVVIGRARVLARLRRVSAALDAYES